MKKKFVFEKNSLSQIDRIRIKENRDLKKGIRLNRNERVDNFEKNILTRIFSKINDYDLGKYPDHEKIYEELSKFLKIKKDNILITSGIDGSLKSIFEIFLKKGDRIAVLNPTYAMYKVYSDVFSTKLITINYNKDFKLDKSTLYEVIKKGKIKVLFLPNPNQPIEDIISFKEMKKICKICLQKKILLVVDEAYHMFGAPTMSKLINTFRNIVILRTLSKSFGLPSIRFGFIISNKRIIKTMNSYRLSYESNFLTDTVVSYFLKNYKIIKNNINKIKKGREFVRSECLKLNYDVIGKYSNFLLINFKNPKIKNIIVQNLEKNKIYTKSNYSGILENCILVTCGSKKIMKKFIKLIKI